MSAFVDTSALYALLVQTEEGHAEVATAFRKLVQTRRVLTTSNYVLLETMALLQHRFGLDAVRDLQTRLVPLLHIRWVDAALHRRALDRLLRTDRRKLSLVDCSSFVLMDADGISAALTLDADFAAQGYSVLPFR